MWCWSSFERFTSCRNENIFIRALGAVLERIQRDLEIMVCAHLHSQLPRTESVPRAILGSRSTAFAPSHTKHTPWSCPTAPVNISAHAIPTKRPSHAHFASGLGRTSLRKTIYARNVGLLLNPTGYKGKVPSFSQRICTAGLGLHIQP